MGLQSQSTNAGIYFLGRVGVLLQIILTIQDMKENKYFREYINEIEKSFPLSDLSYFELNLETWRQLWRVLEMSDILLVVIDSRFPVTQKLHSYFIIS